MDFRKTCRFRMYTESKKRTEEAERHLEKYLKMEHFLHTSDTYKQEKWKKTFYSLNPMIMKSS